MDQAIEELFTARYPYIEIAQGEYVLRRSETESIVILPPFDAVLISEQATALETGQQVDYWIAYLKFFKIRDRGIEWLIRQLKRMENW